MNNSKPFNFKIEENEPKFYKNFKHFKMVYRYFYTDESDNAKLICFLSG